MLLKTFAIDIASADRFNTLIGAIFLIIVFVSPDGVLGLWRNLAPALAQKRFGKPDGKATSKMYGPMRGSDPREEGMNARTSLLTLALLSSAALAFKEANYTADGKKIEVIKGLSDASPDSAVKAARKLVEQDRVKILIGPLSGDEGLAVKDYAKTQPNVTFINGTSAAQVTRPYAISRRTSTASPPTARSGWPALANTHTRTRAITAL